MKKIEPSKTNKKSAIVSLGTRISLSSNNVRSVDLKFMRQYLLNVLGREQVDYISKKTKKEADLDYFKDTTETNFNDYDEIYIYNASFNPFGGLFKDEALDTFEKLYDFNGDIIYFVIDPKLAPMDFAGFLRSRNKKGDYVFGTDAKTKDFKRHINPEIVDGWTNKVWKRMKIAFDGQDYEKYCKMWNLSSHKTKGTYKWLNEDVEWFSMWIAEYYAMNERLDLKLKDYVGTEKKYDLVYFGNNRQNERNKVIKELYDSKDLKKYFIGFDPQLTNTNVEKYVDHDELFKIIGENCLATVVIGDNMHNANIRTARFFESMLLDVVAFIYSKYDPNKNYVNNEFLKDFIYVSNKQELKDKIEKIKNDKELYDKIVELERQEIIVQFEKYKEK